MTSQQAEPGLPVRARVSPAEAWVKQWPATGSGSLTTTVLGAEACSHKSFLKEVTITSVKAKLQGGNTAPPISRKLD